MGEAVAAYSKPVVRRAKPEDLNMVMELVAQSIAIMRQQDNPQWDGSYPARENFAQDIAEGTLFVCQIDRAVAGVMCINTEQPQEYLSQPWVSAGQALVIHRMAVAPRVRRKGVGTMLMRFAQEQAKAQGYACLRTDTYSKNTAMNTLFQKNGYYKVGELFFKGKPRHFNCYEKCL